MSDTRWFYARDNQQAGPVSLEELRQLAASGQLRREDMIWAEGTPAWLPAGTQTGLFEGASAPPSSPAAVSATGAGPGSLGYFEPTRGLPLRAAATLRGHTLPTGDTGDWPLDDARVEQFQQTVKLRKRITAAAQLYRLLFLLAAIGCAAMLVVMVVTLAATTGRGGAGSPMVGVGVTVGVVLAIAMLYYFAWKYTARSHRWAPLMMFIIFMLGVAVNLFGMIMGMATGNTAAQTGVVVGGLFGSILPGVFGYMSWQAFSAIPKFLAQPAWCQEVLVNAGV